MKTKRLQRIAQENDSLKLAQYILDILNDDINPICDTLKTVGNGYGIKDTIKYINELKDEYNFVSKKAQEMDKATNISYNCNAIKQLCNNCIDELNDWHERHEQLPRGTQDDLAELESSEYIADKLVISLIDSIDSINIDIESEADDILHELTKQSSISKVARNYDGSEWYNSEDGDLMKITVNSDGSVYGYGNRFDFDAENIDKALQKLKMWNYYES